LRLLYSAWEGDGAASQQSFDQFKQGFANTASVVVKIGKPSRSDPEAGSVYRRKAPALFLLEAGGRKDNFCPLPKGFRASKFIYETILAALLTASREVL
jgi:hypothetical protein